jgi:hypothetical protein
MTRSRATRKMAGADPWPARGMRVSVDALFDDLERLDA